MTSPLFEGCMGVNQGASEKLNEKNKSKAIKQRKRWRQLNIHDPSSPKP